MATGITELTRMTTSITDITHITTVITELTDKNFHHRTDAYENCCDRTDTNDCSYKLSIKIQAMHSNGLIYYISRVLCCNAGLLDNNIYNN